MSGGVEDVFGVRPNRPDHPDFWRLSEVVLGLDAGLDEAGSDAVKERLWHDRVAGAADVTSVIYMGIQRAMRAFGEPRDLAAIRVQSAATALWVDAFVAGVEFQRRGGHRDE